jgi:hypothetical protein
MPNFNDIFRESLRYFLREHKNKSQYARYLGLSADLLNKLLRPVDPFNVSEIRKRAIAAKLGFQERMYENFLDIGRAILNGKAPDLSELQWDGMTGDELRERGFITVPFSDNMKLAAGSGGTIPITDSVERSKIIIHGPSLKRTTSRHLQAFRVGGDSMEPVIAEGGIVLADTSDNVPERLREGKIYVICWDLREGECAVKYLSWAKKKESVLITSPDIRAYPPIVRALEDIQLIGRVIWSWREH